MQPNEIPSPPAAVFSTLDIQGRIRLADLLGSPIFATGRPVILTVTRWPPGAPRTSWLQAILRRCQLAGAPLVVVSANTRLTNRARALHIPVFASVDRAAQYLENAKPTPDRSFRRPRRARSEDQRHKPVNALMTWHWSWLSLVTSLVLGLAGVAAAWGFTTLVMPTATITVYPAVGQLEVTVPMTASLAVDQPDNDVGLIPARFVSTAQEFRRTGPTSARKLLPTAKATGVLLAINQTQDPVTVPAGVVVQTGTGQAIRFVTTEEITVPASSQYQQPILIEAAEAGETGNVPANSITHIAGPFAFQLWITNPQPTTDGASDLLPVVSQADNDRLQAELLAEATSSAQRILTAKLADGEWLPPTSLDVDLQWASTDFFFGEATEELTMTMMVNISGIAVNTRDMVEYVMDQVARHTPASGLLLPASLNLSLQPDPSWTEAELTFSVTAAVDYLPPLAEGPLRRAVAGLAPEEAVAQLTAWSPAGVPTVELFPSTQEVLPRLIQRIRVRAHVPT